MSLYYIFPVIFLHSRVFWHFGAAGQIYYISVVPPLHEMFFDSCLLLTFQRSLEDIILKVRHTNKKVYFLNSCIALFYSYLDIEVLPKPKP